jgi:hypothetical protein
MRVFFDGRVSIDQAQLPSHPEMHHEKNVVVEIHEDELPASSDAIDAHAGDRIDELLRLGIPDDRRKQQLAADDGAAGEVRPQVRDDGLYLR